MFIIRLVAFIRFHIRWQVSWRRRNTAAEKSKKFNTSQFVLLDYDVPALSRLDDINWASLIFEIEETYGGFIR